MKTILFPTDFSACAENALEYTVQLAEKSATKILLHNSCHASTVAFNPIETDSSVEENISKQALNNLLHYVKKEKLSEKNIFTDCDVSFGLAVDNINNLAKEKNASFIIMGTKGSTGINEIILGSITSKVIENAPCPVMIIPDKTKYKEIKKIIFATDFHANDIESINFIEKLFSPSITKKCPTTQIFQCLYFMSEI